MQLYEVSLLVSAVLNLILGIIVFFKNTRSRVNRSFFLMVLGVSGWCFSVAFAYFSGLTFWVKSSFFFAVIMVYFFVQFGQVFPNIISKYAGLVRKIGLVFSILFVLLIPFNTIVQSSILVENQVKIIYGSMYKFLGIFFLVSVIFTFYELIKKLKKSVAVQKQQIRYFFLGAFIFSVLALLTNLILPLVGVNKLNFAGPSFSVIMIAFITYAIIKHRLLDIRLVILRTITYSLVVLLISTTVVGFTLLLPEIFGVNITAKTIIAIAVSIFIVIVLEPLKRVIGRATDQLFFKARIDYQKLLTELSEIINREIDLDILLHSLSMKLEKGLKIKNVSIYLAGAVGGAFYKRKGRVDERGNKADKVKMESLGDSDRQDLKHHIPHSSLLLERMRHTNEIMVLEDLERKMDNAQDERERQVLEKLKKELDELGASVVAPVMVGNSLNAVIVLGSKLSGDSFSVEDFNLLELIGSQLASALEKSRLYEEEKQFSERLKKEVQMATMHLRDVNLKLQEANDHLQKLDQAKSEFVSITSHQLRTPMTGIMGYLSMILQGDFGKVPKELEKIIQGLFEESRRMIRIINLFLNVSKIESGKMEFNFTPVQIEEVIEKVILSTKQEADKKGLKLVYKKPNKPLPPVLGDKDKLGDIILNFTDNAIKYTVKGSVMIDSFVEGDKMHITVKDTGRGIKPEEAKNLFTKFVRGYGIAQVNPDGSGLGLYVARRMAEAHNGKVWVDSEGLDKGSTFHTLIPLYNEKRDKDSLGVQER